MSCIGETGGFACKATSSLEGVSIIVCVDCRRDDAGGGGGGGEGKKGLRRVGAVPPLPSPDPVPLSGESSRPGDTTACNVAKGVIKGVDAVRVSGCGAEFGRLVVVAVVNGCC